MLIDGYDDGPVVAGEGLIGLPGFWAAHFAWLDGPLDEWFGVDGDAVNAAEEALWDEDAWPVFRVPFGGGHTAVVRYANQDEDAAIEFFVAHPGWDRHGYLATIDGHQAGPGLAWRELIHIAGTPAPEASGVQDPHARLLLLLPALGDADTPAEAVEVVAEALRWATVPEAASLARRLLGKPMFAAARWGTGANGILVCDAGDSPRCGISLAQGISGEQSGRLARALGTWPS